MATIREFFQNLLYQVPAIGITDIVDILVVSIIFYSLLRLIRSTSAARVARAILLLLAITLLTDVLNLYTLNWLLNKILEVGAIALIIVFQPELRRALERVGAQLHFHLLATEPTASIEQSAVNATEVAYGQLGPFHRHSCASGSGVRANPGASCAGNVSPRGARKPSGSTSGFHATA